VTSDLHDVTDVPFRAQQLPRAQSVPEAAENPAMRARFRDLSPWATLPREIAQSDGG